MGETVEVEFICKCGQIMLDEDVWYSNKCNDEGEDYSEARAYCEACNTDYEASQYGEIENNQQAKELLTDKYKATVD